MGIVLVVLVAILVVALLNWFHYLCVARGIFYYLLEKYNDDLEVCELEKLTKAAARRTIKDLFKRD